MKRKNTLRDFEIYMMKKSIKEENEKKLASLADYHFEKYAESKNFMEFTIFSFARFVLTQMRFKRGNIPKPGDVWK